MDIKAIEETLRAIIVKHADNEPTGELSHATRFRDDLGLDSLVLTEMLFDVEEKFDIRLSDEAVRGFTTVGNLVSYLQQHNASSLKAESRV